MPPAVASIPRPPSPRPSRNPREAPPWDPRVPASAPMVEAHLGLGASAQTSSSSGGLDASATRAPSAPPLRAPRFAKRRHPLYSSSRSQPPPAPWDPSSSASGGGGSAQGGAFVFGAGANGSGNVAPRDRVIGNARGAGFVLGASAASCADEKNIGSSRAPVQSPKSVETSEPATSPGAHFEFDSTRGCFNSGTSSSLHFEKGSSGKLLDKMRRLNLWSSGKCSVIRQADRNHEVAKNSNFPSGVGVFGARPSVEANVLPEKMKQLNIDSGMPSWGTRSGDVIRLPEVCVFESNTTTSRAADSCSKIVFGATVNASTSVHGTETSVLPEKMRQLNIDSGMPSRGMRSGDASRPPEVFVFESNTTTGRAADSGSKIVSAASVNASASVHGTETNVLPEKMRQLNIDSGMPSRCTRSGDASRPPEMFVFEGNTTTGHAADGCSKIVSGASVNASASVHGTEASVLPEKMRQLNIGSGMPSWGTRSGDVSRPPEVFVFESNTTTGRAADSCSKIVSGASVDASTLVHGTETNVLPEKMRQLNIGRGMPSRGTRSEDASPLPEVFVFGSNTTMSHAADNGSKIVSGSSVDASTSVHGTETNVLPEKMRQLNIGHNVPLPGMKSDNPNHPTEMFVFGSNRTTGSVSGTTKRSTMDNSSNFVFREGTSSSSSVHSMEGNKLPEKMTWLNIGSATPLQRTGENANHRPEVIVFGSNGTTRSSMDNVKNLLSGSSTNASRSARDTEASILPEKMKKLSMGSGVPSQSCKSENVTHQPEVFILGSNSTTIHVSGQTAGTLNSCTNAPFESLNTTVDSTNKGLKNPIRSGVSADNGYGQSVFVFGGGCNSTVQLERDAANVLHDDIKKLNVSGEAISAGYGKVNDAPTSVKFSFQSSDETSSRYGSVPNPKSQECCDLVTPLDSSSNFPTSGNGMSDFGSRTIHAGAEATYRACGAVKQDVAGLSRESLFGRECIKTAYRDKKGEHKSTRKKDSTRLKQHGAPSKSVSKQANTKESEVGSPGDYSPMDCSPYAAPAEEVTREASVTCNESIHLYSSNASTQNLRCVENDLVSATQNLVIDSDLPNCEVKGNIPDSSSNFNAETNLYQGCSNFANSDASTQPCFTNADVGITGDTSIAAIGGKADRIGSNIEGEISEESTSGEIQKFGEPFTSALSSTNFSGLNLNFSVKLPAQSSSSKAKHHWRRKLRTKSVQASPSLWSNVSQDTKGMQCFPETGRIQDLRREKVKTNASSHVAFDASERAFESCEMWRVRGNQEYGNGHFATAEEHYTRGINSISHHGASRRCSHSLMLCYSNRGATRMCLGRMREALQDCMLAASIDPIFIKAKVRAANCQLALGDIEEALKTYAECLQSSNTASLDTKMITEASDGLRKAQKVVDWISQSKELLKKKTSSEVTTALELISNALFISSHSDDLMEMKAEALLMLRRYEEVIQLCQETIDLAERNSVLWSTDGESKNPRDTEKSEYPERLWRSYLIAKSYFYLGRLEDALELLKKHEQAKPAGERLISHRSTSPECLSSLLATVNQLLRLKAAGNEAFQAGRYSEAVEQYSAALTCNSESRPFTAVCFCNRAAAYQALGQVTDAIADCSLAMVLDANYPKAISRRATLYEMIRDYAQAASDLRKLISLLEKQVSRSAVCPKVGNSHKDLKEERARLSSAEDEARKETPLNLYLILGVDPSCSTTDVKKAYRKAALRHHPDKAAQLLVRNENTDERFWRDVAKEVHADADHLFKTIGEAYNVLSDTEKREEYDAEEEMRNATRRSYKGRSTRMSPEHPYSKYDGKNSRTRQWWSYRNVHRSHWPGYSDAQWY